jgi:hypothetical protein
MKQFLYIFFLGVVMASCNDNTASAGKESSTTVNEDNVNDDASGNMQPGANDVDVDTLGMAEFLAMKAAEAARQRSNGGQFDNIQSSGITDVNGVNVDTIGFAEFKRLKAETASRNYEDSIKRAGIIAERRRANASRNIESGTTERSSKASTSKKETGSSNDKDVVSETPAPVKEKKGWSKKAKGAVIGAATGAAAGAVINKKNRGVGGVVGGIIGGAAGYGVGRHKDKKDEAKKDTTEQQQ